MISTRLYERFRTASHCLCVPWRAEPQDEISPFMVIFLSFSQRTLTVSLKPIILSYMCIVDYTVLHYTVLHCTALHYTVLHYTALHYTALHYTVLHSTALHYTALHYTVLHYTALLELREVNDLIIDPRPDKFFLSAWQMTSQTCCLTTLITNGKKHPQFAAFSIHTQACRMFS